MAHTAAIITVSDKGFSGEREDRSGPALEALLKEEGFCVLHRALVPDETEAIRRELLYCADEAKIELILTTGGTGFSPRDITPEASLPLFEKNCPGLSELMRQRSLQITDRACLSRGVCGIRKASLILNLPGSPKGACENLQAVLKPLLHGLEMLRSAGSADCAEKASSYSKTKCFAAPSLEDWMREAEASAQAEKIGMYLSHRGVVRKSPKREVREGLEKLPPVKALRFSYDRKKAEDALRDAKALPGIFFVKLWLNEGELPVGTPIMQILVGGDIRPNVFHALESLVERLKRDCILEEEIYQK